jgi:hypothetical protein
MGKINSIREYLSLILVFAPASLLAVFLCINSNHPNLHIKNVFPYLPWQFILSAFFGFIALLGGMLDWKFHRKELNRKVSKKERLFELIALGFGGLPLFILLLLANISNYPNQFLVPILLVLIFTVALICYDEFVFHRNRCGIEETIYHRMLVLGNGSAFVFWIHFIYA